MSVDRNDLKALFLKESFIISNHARVRMFQRNDRWFSSKNADKRLLRRSEFELIINTRKNTLNYMSHKTLTISEEAYEALAELKKEGESFTGLIKRITQPLRKKKLSDFLGLMAGEEFDDFEKAALEVRHSMKSRSNRLKL